MLDVERLGLRGTLIMGGVLVAAQTALFRKAIRLDNQSATQRRPRFFDLIVTREDNRYSLSRIQVYLWTVAVALTYAAAAYATGQFVNVPERLALLLGLNVTSAVASTAIYSSQENKMQAAGAPTSESVAARRRPNFVEDVFFEHDGPASLDLPRTQMFLWTIITLGTFVVAVLRNFPTIASTASGGPILPEVPLGMVALMGISQGAYLGAKAASFVGPVATSRSESPSPLHLP